MRRNGRDAPMIGIGGHLAVPPTGSPEAVARPRDRRVGKAPSEMPSFQPYWGKPAVRNDRGDRGDVGIIRSPVRASILPDPSHRT
jgi:hypothetical protein